VERTDLTACIIARDEGDNIREAVDSVWKIAGQIVVVDTGSIDNTADLAERAGAEVHHFAWCNDFAAARNESLRHARGRWIIWFDCDDRITPENQGKIKNIPGDDLRVAWHLKVENPKMNGSYDMTCNQLRIFPRLPQVCFEGRVHEQVIYSLHRAGCHSGYAEAAITHIGYMSPERCTDKFARNLTLLRADLADRPDDPYLWYHLLHTLNASGDQEGAIRAALYLIRRTSASVYFPEIYLAAHVMISRVYVQLGNPQEARRWLLLGMDSDPNHGPTHFFLGEDANARGAFELGRWHLTRFLECAQTDSLALPLDDMKRTARKWIREIQQGKRAA
jgi:glycosyltransferase involved in cell wall biosynthesis